MVTITRQGTFGYRVRDRQFEMVSGATLIGFPGDEYMCTHDHACGDECLSFRPAPEVAETVAGAQVWKHGALPPLPQIMVLGELAQAATSSALQDGQD